MTVIVFREGGIMDTHTDVAYIETDSNWGSTPDLVLKDHNFEPIATVQRWLKIEVLP